MLLAYDFPSSFFELFLIAISVKTGQVYPNEVYFLAATIFIPIFFSLQYATQEVDGVKYMNAADFIQRYLKLLPVEAANEESIRLLAGIVDTSKDGYVSLSPLRYAKIRCTISDKRNSPCLICQTSQKEVSFNSLEQISTEFVS